MGFSSLSAVAVSVYYEASEFQKSSFDSVRLAQGKSLWARFEPVLAPLKKIKKKKCVPASCCGSVGGRGYDLILLGNL